MSTEPEVPDIIALRDVIIGFAVVIQECHCGLQGEFSSREDDLLSEAGHT